MKPTVKEDGYRETQKREFQFIAIDLKYLYRLQLMYFGIKLR